MADAAAAGASTPAALSPSEPQETAQTPQQPAADLEPWKKVKHKVKVNGAESELDYDDLVRGYQLASASHQKMQQANQIQRQLSEAWNAADPQNFFKAKNLDPEKWAEDLLLKKLKLQNMTPEQKAQFEAEQRSKQEREEFENQKKAFEEQQKAIYNQQITNQLDTEIFDAFKATNLEVDPVTVDLMARTMEAYFDQYGEMLPAKVALDQVLGYVDQGVSRKVKSLTADQLRSMLSKEQLDALRKQDIELVRSQSPMRQASNGASKPSTPAPKAQKRMSSEEAFKQLEAKFSS